MKSFLTTLLISLLSLALHAAPASFDGVKTEYQQPGGKKLTLYVIGSQYYARTVTPDGYTVCFNYADNTYYYAKLNANGTELIPTQLIVGKDKPVGLEKHIKLPAHIRKQKWTNRYQQRNAKGIARWKKRVKAAQQRRKLKAQQKKQAPNIAPAAGDQSPAPQAAPADAPLAAPVNGNKVGLTILVQFPDDPDTAAADPTNFPTSQIKIDRYCNEIGYADDGNTNSVRGYFRNQSLQALDYTSLVTPIVTVPNPRNFYNYSDYPANNTLRDSGSAARLLIQHAIQQLNNLGFNYDQLTIENGTNVLATNVLFAGNNSGVWSEGLWPHRWVTAWHSTPITINGATRYISDYQITNISNNAPEVGTFIHENGHLILDYPDLYDYGGDSAGIGRHGLMASGNHNNNRRTPAPINLYFKDIVGWANIVDLTPQEYRLATLPSTGNVGFRIRKPGTQNEYFLIENRGNGDPWATAVPDRGIMIWHVDENVNGNNDQQMTAAQHYEISLEQSDNRFDLENNIGRGDATDLYDINTPLFTDASSPDAHWWDGSNSGINIRVLSQPGSNMQVEFGINNTLTVLSPNGGETIDDHSTTTITWGGNIAGNVRIDLYKNGNFFANLALNETNDGSFNWTLNGNYPLASDYRIRITSIDDNTILDESNADFTIATEQFCGQGIFPVGWESSDHGWAVVSTDASEGTHSLKSNDIIDNEKATISYSHDFLAGNITFSAKVSSEFNYDYLHFYIDNIEQDINPTSTKKGISGEVDWQQFTFPVTEGNHTFTWTYSKDFSVSNGSDAAWLDGVTLPPLSLTGIEAWKVAQFGNDANDPIIAGDDADPDKDGQTNLLEYALNTDPNDPGKTGVLTSTATSSTLSLIYPRNTKANDLNFIVEVSTEGSHLSNWNPAAIAETIISTSNGTEMVKATYTMPPTDTRCFLRLKVTRK